MWAALLWNTDQAGETLVWIFGCSQFKKAQPRLIHEVLCKQAGCRVLPSMRLGFVPHTWLPINLPFNCACVEPHMLGATSNVSLSRPLRTGSPFSYCLVGNDSLWDSQTAPWGCLLSCSGTEMLEQIMGNLSVQAVQGEMKNQTRVALTEQFEQRQQKKIFFSIYYSIVISYYSMASKAWSAPWIKSSNDVLPLALWKGSCGSQWRIISGVLSWFGCSAASDVQTLQRLNPPQKSPLVAPKDTPHLSGLRPINHEMMMYLD